MIRDKDKVNPKLNFLYLYLIVPTYYTHVVLCSHFIKINTTMLSTSVGQTLWHSTSVGKTLFAWCFILNERLTISYQKSFIFSVSVLWFKYLPYN